MKKLIILALAAALVLSLCACSQLESAGVDIPEEELQEAVEEVTEDIAESSAEAAANGAQPGLSPRFQLWYDSFCLAGGKCHAQYRAQNEAGDWVDLIVGGFNVNGAEAGDSLYYAGMADGSYLAMSINGTAYVLLADQKLAVTTEYIDTSAVNVPGTTEDIVPAHEYITGAENLFGEDLEYDEVLCQTGDAEVTVRVYTKAGTEELRYIATSTPNGWYYLELISYSDEIPEQFTKIPDDYTVMDASALGGMIDPDALSSFDLEGADLSGLEGLDLSELDLEGLEGIDLGDLDLSGIGG